MPRKTALNSKYSIDSKSGCWVWKKPLANGYGQLRHNGGDMLAHRVFFESKHGPIPDGLVIDHLCRNRACVNPDHLEAVTQAVNTQRGDQAKIGNESAKAIRERYSLGELQVQLASEFGVCLAVISEIVRGKSWKEAGGPIVSSGRNRPKPGKRKLTDSDISEIRELKKFGQKRRAIANRFGITIGTVDRVVSGRHRFSSV